MEMGRRANPPTLVSQSFLFLASTIHRSAVTIAITITTTVVEKQKKKEKKLNNLQVDGSWRLESCGEFRDLLVHIQQSVGSHGKPDSPPCPSRGKNKLVPSLPLYRFFFFLCLRVRSIEEEEAIGAVVVGCEGNKVETLSQLKRTK